MYAYRCIIRCVSSYRVSESFYLYNIILVGAVVIRRMCVLYSRGRMKITDEVIEGIGMSVRYGGV